MPALADQVALHGIPALELAREAGEARAAGVTMPGAYSALTSVFDADARSKRRSYRATGGWGGLWKTRTSWHSWSRCWVGLGREENRGGNREGTGGYKCGVPRIG